MQPVAPTPDGMTTIERHILEEQMSHPGATGALTGMLYDLALAGKVISNAMNHAGLVKILGRTGETNVQGEEVMKLDVLADQTIRTLNARSGRVAAMVSEEQDDIVQVPDGYPNGKYVLLFDPLDGSSNIDYNVSVGTIFAIYQRLSPRGPATLDDCLQKGRNLVAAGYIVYSASTMLVYSAGRGVHGFTLDLSIGEFLMSHPNIRIPAEGRYYSVDQGYEQHWSEGVRRFTKHLQGLDGNGSDYSQRYVGSLVADFHRTLLSGGVFYYPANTKEGRAQGKLRLLYEAIPLAFIAEQAGGFASNGSAAILDIQPTALHQRTPLFVGSRGLVEEAERFVREHG
jgi:fructose-1,6-bisphosphatase I